MIMNSLFGGCSYSPSSIKTLHPGRLASAVLYFAVNECLLLIANQKGGLMDPEDLSANSNSVASLIDTQLDNHIQACGAPALVPPAYSQPISEFPVQYSMTDRQHGYIFY